MSPSTEKSSNLTVKYAFIQGFFWMNFAVIMGFSSLYLLDVGFSNTQIGLLIAAAGIISAVLQPTIASYADSPSSPSLKRIVSVFTILVIVMGLLLIFSKGSLLLTGLLYGGCITILQLLTPLVNALGMESINQGKRLNFGVSRGMGSVAYAVAAYILGIVADRTGAGVVPVATAGVFAALFFFLMVFPFQKTVSESSKKEKNSQSPLYFFKRYPRFAVVLIGCVLLYISHVLLNSFTFQIVESKGGTSAEMGFSMALASLIELPTMFLFGYMLKKVRCDIWFRISGIFFMLKCLGSLLAPNMPVFYAIQLFQLLGWALITVSSVYYVNSIMDSRDAIKGQAYMTMTYTLGSVLGALLGGPLIDKAGVAAMLTFGTAAAAIGMIILLFATEKTSEMPH
ncbi:MFS transporter [Ruminococcus sp. 5_1_39BFAA]|uniref:MFS transporter n=1 Tax=Ruminococcus sp. 5_1_39BFAA TaxID=457412 RepID=UPI003565163A